MRLDLYILNACPATAGQASQLLQTYSIVLKKVSGLSSERATPVPIPNTEVKSFSADGTARAAVWESRTRPVFYLKRRQ